MFIGILQISIFAQAEDAVLHNGKMRSPPFPGNELPFIFVLEARPPDTKTLSSNKT